VILIFAVAQPLPTARSQTAELSRERVYRSWKKEHGLPSDWIEAVLQTSDRYLWLATKRGLTRFDGVRFTVFDRFNTPRFLDSRCTALAQTPDGTLWIGTRGGLVLRHPDGEFQRFDDLPHPHVTRLRVLHDGMVHVVTPAGEQVRHRTGSREPRPADRTPLMQLLDESPLPRELGVVQASYMDRVGRAWLLASPTPQAEDAQLYRFSDQSWQRVGTDTYNNRTGFFFLEDAMGRLWFPGDDGTMIVHHNDRSHRVTIRLDRPEDLFLSGCFDSEGNLWLGTAHSGVYRFRPAQMKSFSIEEGLLHPWVRSIAQGPDGRLWFGTEGGLTRWRSIPGGMYPDATPSPLDHVFTAPGILVTNRVHSLGSHPNGEVWVGLHGGGPFRWRDDQWTGFPLPGDHDDNKVNTILPDADLVWIGTVRRLHVLAQGHMLTLVQPLPEIPHLIDREYSNLRLDFKVRTIARQNVNDLWVGTDSAGLFRLDRRAIQEWLAARASGNPGPPRVEVEMFRIEDGLSNNSILALHVDEEDPSVLWVGTEHGLNRFVNGSWTAFTTRNGLPNDAIRQILEHDHHLWIGSEDGIFRVSKADLHAVATGQSRSVHCVLYDESDGMPSRETSGETNDPAGCKTQEGILWFGTRNGAVRIDPDRIRRLKIPPTVVIEQFRANDQVVHGDADSSGYEAAIQTGLTTTGSGQRSPPQTTIRLAPGTADVLEFRYTGICLSAPEKVRFKIKLEGYDQDWRQVGDRRVAFYTNLRPGHYQFRVRAANADHVWNEEGAFLGFQIAPRFIQTRSFWGSTVALCVVAGFGVHRWQLSRSTRIQRLEREMALLRERERLARDLHDGLGANLTRLALLAATGDSARPHPAEMRDWSEKLSLATRDALHAVKDVIWSSHPANDSIESLMLRICSRAESLFLNSPTRCRFDLPDAFPALPLTPDQRLQIFLAANEALNNAARHARAQEVQIIARSSMERFTLSIRDDGRGFDATPAAPGAEPASRRLHQGQGLRNMRDRILAAGGRLRIESWPGHGTTIEILMGIQPTP
jgi:signal transduction histidine kinase/ligand-binding sensor domain-containing protein